MLYGECLPLSNSATSATRPRACGTTSHTLLQEQSASTISFGGGDGHNDNFAAVLVSLRRIVQASVSLTVSYNGGFRYHGQGQQVYYYFFARSAILDKKRRLF